jgi:hypothetical protein
MSMRVVSIRSKPELDRVGKPSNFAALHRGVTGDEDDSIHYAFEFEDYPGETPHARVSLTWADVEVFIEAFAKKGHPSALRLERARKLAAAVDDFASPQQTGG